jgi:hypothetical protein
MTGLRFLFRVTLRRLDLATEIYHIREPERRFWGLFLGAAPSLPRLVAYR